MLSRRVTRGRANPLHWKFSQRLCKARQDAGLTASALSLAAGLGRSSVAQLEAGPGIPLLSTAERLADVLRVSPGWLVYGLTSDWAPATELRCKGLAARLREVRDERGLTLAEVGKYAGSSGAAVLAVERKTLPTIATLENLATALGVSPAWLAFGMGDRELPRRGSRGAAAAPASEPAP